MPPNRPLASIGGLRLELFGGPNLWRGSLLITLTPLQAGLIALAAVAGRERIPRGTAQRLLWGQPETKAVRHRISQLVYQTNQRCEAKLVSLLGESIHLEEEIVTCDLSEFRALTGGGSLQSACDLEQRGFLSAFPPSLTPAFADWMDEQRLTFRSVLRERAMANWAVATKREDWPQARNAAETLLRLEPTDEFLLRRVILAQAKVGAVREAESLYRSFVERVSSVVEWIPEPETEELIEAVRIAERESDPAEHDPPETKIEAPMCGRAEELACLIRNIYRQGSAGCCVAVVSGEAGVGKTRLAKEAMKAAPFRRCKILEAQPTERERGLAFNVLSDCLNQPWIGPTVHLLKEPWRSIILSLFPRFRKESEPLPEPPDGSNDPVSRQVCDAFLELFRELTKTGRIVLFVDDFHFADDESATVLRFLQRRWKNDRLAVLLTYNTTYSSQFWDESRAAFGVLQEMEVSALTTAIHLGELSRPAAKELVGTVLGEKSNDSLLEGVVRLAGGSPFYLIQLATSHMANQPAWQTQEPTPVPDPLSRAIWGRIDALEPATRNVLFALAVFKRKASLDEVIHVSGYDHEVSADALDRLQHQGLVQWVDSGVQFRHEIVRLAVYEKIPPAYRILLHGASAETLIQSQRKSTGEDAALHHFSAGEMSLARLHALTAIGDDSSLGGPGVQLRLLELAYEASDCTGASEVAARLAQAQYESRRVVAASNTSKVALSARERLALADSLNVRLILTDCRHLVGLDAPQTTLKQLQELEAEARQGGEEAMMAKIMDVIVQVHHMTGDARAVTGYLDRLRKIEVRDPNARCRILSILAMDALYRSPDEGLAASREAVALATEADLAEEIMLAWHRHVLAMMIAGLIFTDEGKSAVAAARKVGRVSQDRHSFALMLFNLVSWHISVGSIELATDTLREAMELSKPMDCPRLHLLEVVSLGNIIQAKGDFATALDTFRQARLRTSGDVSIRYLGALEAMEGLLLLEGGKNAEVDEIMEKHHLDSSPYVTVELILLHARRTIRKGQIEKGMAVLERGLKATKTARPIWWIQLALEFVRLARRHKNPRPDLAKQARKRATELSLPGLAHHFVPFVD